MYGVSVVSRMLRNERQKLIKEIYPLDNMLIKKTLIEKILNHEDRMIFDKLINNKIVVDHGISIQMEGRLLYIDIKYYVYLIGIKNIVSTEYCCKITLSCVLVNLQEYNYMRFEITCHTRPIGTHVRHMGWYHFGKKFPTNSYTMKYSYSNDNRFNIKLILMSNSYHPTISSTMDDEEILIYIKNYNMGFLTNHNVLMSNKLTLILSYTEHDRFYNQQVFFDKCKYKSSCRYPTICTCGNNIKFDYLSRFFK